MALRNLGAVFSRLSLTSVTTRSTKQLSHSWPHSRLPPLPTASNTPLSSLSLGSVTCTALTSSRQCFTVHPCDLSSQSLLSPKQLFSQQVRGVSSSVTCLASLNQMHRTGPIKKKRKNKNPLVNRPFARGVVLKTLIKKPKKPNSANRKCVLVRLTTGRDMIAYVPGEGHNLQEHNIVLVRPGRLRDTPGVKLKCVRGKYDLQHVIKKQH
ncbi:40S ribosomal protein S12, mitochondrial-like [Eriocheir sinensis]|uniref:40S ribosomal protein S12, mitochondrial-like n=1 Tax=Eriocheir sinensis TaxID=95602 RepID=UPI0021CA386D|nr:40S ribosomal protein S12, mitochondrial-like [Eriocheir sinensis]